MESDIGRSMLALDILVQSVWRIIPWLKFICVDYELKISKLKVATAISINVKKSKQAVSQDLLS